MAVEEASATARSLIGALATQPLALALVVLCLGLVGLLYVEANIAERERKLERELLYQNRREVGELLMRCTTH